MEGFKFLLTMLLLIKLLEQYTYMPNRKESLGFRVRLECKSSLPLSQKAL